jgi:uncharacterized membrane protein
MNLDPQFFTPFWLIAGALVYAGVLLPAIRRAQWWRLGNAQDLNVLLYTLLGVFFLWLMNTRMAGTASFAGPTLHLLGATLLTMMFGWAFAIVAMSVVALAFTLLTAPSISTSLLTLPWDVLATGVLPVSISYLLFRVVDRRLPNNFFIYIFICCFFSAALSMASVILATMTIHTLSGAYSLDKLGDSYIPYGLILMFPEAFVTGMFMSIFVVYRPEWVSTFDDQRYLRKRD